MSHSSFPPDQGLYDQRNERDSCGVGFVVNIKNRKSHDIVQMGLRILTRMDHRGAVGHDPYASDGNGILIQIPDAFLRAECATLGIALPAVGEYAVGMAFLPRGDDERVLCQSILERVAAREGQTVLGWRDVPVDSTKLGESVKGDEPIIRQIFIKRGDNCTDVDAFERKLLVIRKETFHALTKTDDMAWRTFHMPSLSARTLVYKGMVLADRMDTYFKDLADPRLTSALALVHQRFSTNTFPSWQLTQPFRYLCHNGEINTLRGNVNWLEARSKSMTSSLLGEDLAKMWPLWPRQGQDKSDSATFDYALELLVAGGYSLAHAMMMMIPEAWADNPLMDEKRRAFYEFHAALMEPWDGPAAVAFTDGRQIGATLDRNGLRPARYIHTSDDLVVMASEAGVLPEIPDSTIIKKWRLQPGKMFLIDLDEGRIIEDAELKETLASSRPYQEWLDKAQIKLDDLPDETTAKSSRGTELLNQQQVFGYTKEDISFFMVPMAQTGQDPIGSMGRDIPLAVLSNLPKRLFDYFHQKFAQVTNPPIDPIREELVMSLVSLIGPRPNLLDPGEAVSHKRLEASAPVLSNNELEKIRRIDHHGDGSFRTRTLDICYPAAHGAAGMAAAVKDLCRRAQETAQGSQYNILILSDRGVNADTLPIPSLLAMASVHHHLISEGLRTKVGLVIETGEARRVHDFCLLAGYGAEAINPYLALETLASISHEIDTDEGESHYIKAVNKGILKVMSKMGISTYQSYCGAQIFDAVGLSRSFVDAYFIGTHTAISGIGLNEVAEETARRHRAAYGTDPVLHDALEDGGDLAFRLRGEQHAWTSETIALLQQAVRGSDRDKYREYARVMDDQNHSLRNLRGLFEFKYAATPVPLDEVDSAASIAKRFATGAISFGAISWEAHTTLAIAMNRLGGKSNTGEGGEEAIRNEPLPNGDSMRSAVKQVASGRFGVTTEYLINADDIQIKMAQGAKPGEGGQLPGHKVDEWIGRVRYSTPGVGLISPPPHHDIYSIEDLAQLIHDLKNVNPEARISVKLVSEVGVGVVAVGVSKAYADHVLISGFDGGTGASPITSILSAGSPWEIGLAETHQTLVLNKLRGRICIQVDGGIRTGRDVVIGALLGADEFGVATAALIAAGCVMMRKCHLNTCPVGVATQDPELRKRFPGQPAHVVNLFTFLIEEIREIMAKLGVRRFNDLIGHSEYLDMHPALDHWKAKGLDLTPLLHKPPAVPGVATFNCETQNHRLENALDHELIAKAQKALDGLESVEFSTKIQNINRTVGGMLSGMVAKLYGIKGLKDNSIVINATGTAGQSFGAFLAHGITLNLLGEANDYVGKSLSGGRIIIAPPTGSHRKAEDNIIVGNTVLYGATSGECYFRGVAGERFAVRNSGATAVVEGVGDHGCEYMTGGTIVVLGHTGRNFAAGMSGGVAYILDEDGSFEQRCNLAMVKLEPVPEEERAMERTHQLNDMETHGLVDILRKISPEDAQRLQILITLHVRFTGSTRGHEILDNWDKTLPKFVKVMPVDYRRALDEMAAKAIGLKNCSLARGA